MIRQFSSLETIRALKNFAQFVSLLQNGIFFTILHEIILFVVILASSNMADRNTFATYGITYDSITMRGTIFRDNTFGFQNATSDFGVSAKCHAKKL